VSAASSGPDATVTGHPAHPHSGIAAPAAAGQPQQPHRLSTAPVVAGVLIGVALAAAVVLALVFVRQGEGDAAGFPGNPPAAAVQTATAASAPTPTAGPETPAEPEALLPIAAEREAVRKTLTTFFASIEARDYETAYDLRIWTLKPGVTRQDALNSFAADHGTTTYEPDITIDDFRYDGADILVDVDFTSHQAVEMAPDGISTCTRWSLYYRMRQTSHAWLIKDAKARSEPGYTSC
jgi:hypothetical protein